MTELTIAATPGEIVPSGETVLIDFDGGRVAVVLLDGEPYPIVRLASNDLGLKWSGQHQKIQNDPAICVREIRTQMPGDDQARTVTTTDLDGFGLWLAKLNANKVAAEARPAVIAWQRRAGRAIRERFFGKPAPTRELSTLEWIDFAREAEVRRIAAESAAGAAEALAIAEHDRAEVELARNAEYEHAEAITVTSWRKSWFSHVPENDFWDVIYDKKRAGLLINQRLTRPKLDRAGSQVFKDGAPVMKDGHEHRHPTAAGQRFFELAPNGVHGGRARFITKVIPGKDAELALRDYLARWFGPGRSQIGA